MTKLRLLRILPPLALGIGVAVWLNSGKEPPGRVEIAERSATVTTITATPAPLAPVVIGYGNVRPAQSWSAVAEVAGTVTWRHPGLETGTMIAGGTHVLTIDPTSYDLAVAQARADLAATAAEAAQIAVEAENSARILALEEQRLALARADLVRTRDLVAQGTAPQVRADEQERATLAIERGVAEIGNALALIPSRQARTEAQAARTRATLARAERDLERTRIVTPFDLRVGQVTVDRFQFVTAGTPLAGGDGVARVEVTAQLPLAAFPRLVGGAYFETEPDTVSVSSLGRAAAMDHAVRRITATVRLVDDPEQAWEGTVLRIENALDPLARSVPVVVAVDDPYTGAAPPVRLPLVPNMYVAITLTAPAGPDVITLPEQAVHAGDTVYLRDADGRLELRPVTVAWRQDNRAVIVQGLEPGDEVVLDDLVPALPGMRLVPQEPRP